MKPLKFKTSFLQTGFFAASLLGLMGCAAAASSDVTAEYNNKALQGDLSTIEETLAAKPESEEAKNLLAKFRARFLERSDGLDFAGEDSLVRTVGERYQNYWRDALLNPGQRDSLEKALAHDIIKILQENGVSSWFLSANNYQDYLSEAFEKREYYGILGRTAPLLEFMIWKENDQDTVFVELTDGIQEVQVNFLSDFVSLGWSSFATFGGPSTGGWAKDDGLFVVTKKWELESESFKISFLKHETRHFADYKLYPELEGADLEYRAKLTELSFAEESVFDLLKKFTDHAARVENLPHPLANWHIITDMSQALLGTGWPTEVGVWKNIPVEEIQAAARKLLEIHDQNLASAGAKRTNGIIIP